MACVGVVVIAVAACDGNQVETTAPQARDSVTGDHVDSQPMIGFSWVVPGNLAAMPRPGIRRALDEDLAFLRGQDIDALVTLTETPLDADALAAVGIESVHLPVRDFTAPTLVQMQAFAAQLDQWTAEGRRVGVHCTAGLGRTGTMVAALMVHRGMSAAEAIAEVRRLRPGSIETGAQEQAVAAFESFIRRSGAPSLDQ